MNIFIDYVKISILTISVCRALMGLITLIPKKDDAQRISDYRPISLLSTSVKIITKLLANRLQTVLSSLFHKNQYGFIKYRTIQDYIAWALEFLHM
jgi:hypothetical protein